jgi:hypothetical protein
MQPLDRQHNALVRNRLAEQGFELTPDELVETRKSAFANIRRAMEAHGYGMPESDEELFLLMLAARSEPEELPELTEGQRRRMESCDNDWIADMIAEVDSENRERKASGDRQ